MGKKVTVVENFDTEGNLINKTVTTEEFVDKNKPLRCHILIDTSGSMRDQTLKIEEGVNNYIMKQKKLMEETGMDIRVAVSTFPKVPLLGIGLTNEICYPLRHSSPANLILPISRTEIRTDGMTPLYDAVGETINMLEADSKDCDVVLVILTDGGENDSRRYAVEHLSRMMKMKQEQGWAILYLGANQDAWAVGSKFGTNRATTSNYTMENMDMAFNVAAASTVRYATARTTASAALTDAEVQSLTDSKSKSKSFSVLSGDVKTK